MAKAILYTMKFSRLLLKFGPMKCLIQVRLHPIGCFVQVKKKLKQKNMAFLGLRILLGFLSQTHRLSLFSVV